MAPNEGSSRSRHGVWSHWVPLAVTLTVATVGVAAWAWTQRKADDDEEHEPGLDYADYEHADYGDNPAYGTSERDEYPPPPSSQPPRATHGMDDGNQPLTSGNDNVAPTWQARVSGALRRTPSPQQFLDQTGKTVAAGVAAAGAAMGKALASIREEDRAYGDSNPWSEEADAKRERTPPGLGKRRKTVALVVSADSEITEGDDSSYHEHASILSHIPRHSNFSDIKLFVLVYAPGLKENTLDAATSNIPPPSISSSFSNIGHEQAQTPGEEIKNPLSNSSSAAFNAIYSQALAITEKESMILPFTTPNGHAHILRHLQPQIIYLQESLAGENGGVITTLQTWLRNDIILVVGAEGGGGGLVDSESEAEKSGKEQKWWQKPERVGRGRGVVVVDSNRVHDDWGRRVQGKE